MGFLIVKLAALGDVLRTTSLLRPLHEKYPGCEISWLTQEKARPLLEGNPLIRQIRTLEEFRQDGPGKKFDLVLSLEEDPSAAEAAQKSCQGELVGIRLINGRLNYTPSSFLYYGMSLLNRDPNEGLKTANALKAHNRLTYAELWLKILDLPLPQDRSKLRPILILTPQDRQGAREFAQKHSLSSKPGPIGVNPGAGKRWPAKQLSEEKTASLLEALHRRFNRPLILLGGREETERNRKILQKTKAPVLDPGTEHDIRSFASILDLCEAVLTTDSLAFHLATALDKKTAVLVGPTSPSELDVFGKGLKLLPEKGCSCFYQSRCMLAESCLDLIPEERFVRALEECLNQ